MRVLVIEDEPRMLELLRNGLLEHGCAVMVAMDGDTGLEVALACEFDAILLDIGLPRLNGFELVRQLRERGRVTRVLILTARDAEDDIIRGLDLGADDYLTKPFSFPELVARLQSITRPSRQSDDGTLVAGDLVVDPLRRLVVRANRNIDLSRSEFSLLISLIRQAGQCVSRRRLADGVWGADANVSSGALDVLVNALRSKIDSSFRDKLIHTVRGAGYMLANRPGSLEHAQ